MRGLRRRFIVDRKFQLEMLVRAGVYCAILFLILGVGVFYPMVAELQSGKDGDAAAVMLYMHRHFWPVALLCVGLAMVVSIQLSHRIAGPLFRLKERLSMLQEGVFPQAVSTRRNDYLKTEIAALNDAIASLGDATDAIKAAELEFTEALESCLDELGDLDRERLQGPLGRVHAKLEVLHRKIHYFKRAGAPDGGGSGASGKAAHRREHPLSI